MKVKDCKVGGKVGRLKIKEINKKRIYAEIKIVTCLCDCGNVVDVRMANLGTCTNSCGCIKVEQLKQRRKK